MMIKAEAKRSLKVPLRQADSLSSHLVIPQAAIFYLANRDTCTAPAYLNGKTQKFPKLFV